MAEHAAGNDAAIQRWETRYDTRGPASACHQFHTVLVQKSGKQPIPLATLYRVVLHYGGYQSTTEKKLWKRVGIDALGSDVAGVGAQCRKAYEIHLKWLEERCALRSAQRHLSTRPQVGAAARWAARVARHRRLGHSRCVIDNH